MTQPDPLQIFTSQINPTFAYTSDGSITIDSIVGGTFPYNISWYDSVGNPLSNQGILTQTSLGFSSTFNGGYTVQVEDTNNCSVSKTLFLNPQNVSSQFGIDSISATNPTCFSSCDGKLFAKMFDVGKKTIQIDKKIIFKKLKIDFFS